MYRKTFSEIKGVVLLSVLVLGVVIGVQAQKMAAEEIIAKHIQSIGKSDDLAKAKLRIALGASEFIIRSSTRKAKGTAYLASNGEEMAFFSTFDMRDYPKERIGIFSNKIEIPTVNDGQRGPLGKFLNSYDRTLNDHIFGGIVFSSWVFLSPSQSKGKLETEGKKKIGDRDVWVVKYTPRDGLTSGSYIRLYFDAENFHHLRTDYRQKETEQSFHGTENSGDPFYSGRAPGNWDADMAANGSTITEDFTDYRTEAGLTLPHKYTILLKIDSSNGTAVFDYFLTINEYRLYKEFPANLFSFQTK